MNILPNSDNLRRRKTDLVKGYVEWVCKLQETCGYDLYFLTFLFNQIPLTGELRRNTMQKEICEYYKMHLPACERRPWSRRGQLNVPRLIAYPDLPVPKTIKICIADARLNDGLHIHAIEAIPITARLWKRNQLLTDLIDKDGAKYISNLRFMRQIYCEILDFSREKYTNYLFKSYLRGYHTEDDVLILPKSISEITKRRFSSDK